MGKNLIEFRPVSGNSHAFNLELVERYERWLVVQRYAAQTRYHYRRCVHKFVAFRGNQGVLGTTHFDVQEFLAASAARGASQQIAESVFSPAEKGKDQATSSPAPKIISIQPINGSLSGGTKVVITGTGFSSVSRTTFGGVSAGGTTIDNDAQITTMAPAHSVGKVDVEVSTTSGQKASLPGAFTYEDLAVTSVAPTSGPAAGGTQVTIKGEGLSSAKSVKIGGVPVTSFSVIGSNSISAVTPKGSTGVADIEIANSDGKAAILHSGFTYN